MKAALYARVSTQDQKTLGMQMRELRSYAKKRGWAVAIEKQEIAGGKSNRGRRDEILKTARQRKVDAIVVWKLDRWGRSLADLITTLTELNELGVAFVSVTEALDLTTSLGRAVVGMLSVFAEFERDVLSERIRAGIIASRSAGRPHGRPRTAAKFRDRVIKLHQKGVNNSEIARRLGIGRSSVVRIIQR